MKLERLDLEGALLLRYEPHEDDRGSFTRTFDAELLDMQVAQGGTSWNARAGTLRGMHLQRAPYAEAKLIRCTRGALHDVLVDLRAGSATHRQWIATELRAGDGIALFAPPGIAHGFVTLVDDTEVTYLLSKPYAPEFASGVRWDDRAFDIKWPIEPTVIAERDATWPDYTG